MTPALSGGPMPESDDRPTVTVRLYNYRPSKAKPRRT